MSGYDNLSRRGVLIEVGDGDASAFGYFLIYRSNLVTQFSGVHHAQNLSGRVLSVNSESRSDGEGAGFTCSISCLSDESVVGLLGDEWNRDTLDNGWFLETKLVYYVVQDVVRDLEMLIILPNLGLRDERLCYVLGILVLDKFDDICLAFGVIS